MPPACLRPVPLLGVAVRFLSAAGLALGLGACVVPAHAPPPPKEPTLVYLLLEGEHTGIVLPLADDEWLEYSYGDWGWVVEGKDSSSYAFYALMNPTPGALGRRHVDGPPMEDPVYARRGSRFQPFLAERERVEALEQRLAEEYQQPQGVPFHNEGFDLDYVPALKDYTLEHHCAHATISWLHALGCEASTSGIIRSVQFTGIEPLPAVAPQPEEAGSASAAP